jgi:hypothetical protein
MTVVVTVGMASVATAEPTPGARAAEAALYANTKAKPTPYRVTAIYEQTGADWQIVQLHFSFAINPYAM